MQHCLKCLLKFIWKEFCERWLQNPQVEKFYSQALTTKPAVQTLISEQYKSSVLLMVLVELLQFYTAVTGNWTWNFAINSVQKCESRKKYAFNIESHRNSEGHHIESFSQSLPMASHKRKNATHKTLAVLSAQLERKKKYGLPDIHVQRLNIGVKHLQCKTFDNLLYSSAVKMN